MYSSTVLVPFSGRLPLDWLKMVLPACEGAGVRKIILIGPAGPERLPETPLRLVRLTTGRPFSGESWREALLEVSTPVVFCIHGDAQPTFQRDGLLRLARVLIDTHANWVYGHYLESSASGMSEHATIDYQIGSLRDGFDFGPIIAFSMDAVKRQEALYGPLADTPCGAAYDLRLRLSIERLPLRLPEILYTCSTIDGRPTGQQIFDYVDPRNREAQIEMERLVTAHLDRIGARMQGEFHKLPPDPGTYPVEASVIIPVRNRVRTVGDAIRSALGQKTDFPFNVLVIDNHSTDGTTELVASLAREDDRVIHLVPPTKDLGIGGCWNLGIQSENCGRIVAQLDSDDLYASPATLATLVDKMNEGPYAMVVGAYRMVNFRLEPIPPGVIDHREWTRDNGRNNLLRVNGIGAPRVFRCFLLRQCPLPNVSYGEDYAAALRISRDYEVGRIFEPLYLCRRWEDNTDANLTLAVRNAHDLYKDRLRTLEILTRQRLGATVRA